MNKNILNIESLSFNYGTKRILNNISFKASPGEYISIIGPNGAGKSTLLKCINRILNGIQGHIEIFEKPLQNYSSKELGRIIGYVSQNRDQVFPYTVYEFVLMGRYPYLTPFARLSNEDKKAVERAIDLIGIGAFADRKILSLSGGEKQKVYLAGALAQQPKILLLDEPTAHLDPKYHMEIQKTIFRICKELGICVLHVTHDLNYISHFSSKIVAIKEGQMIYNDTPEQVLTYENLKKIFDTEFIILANPTTGENIIIPKVEMPCSCPKTV